jgi:hypothetical protein
MLGGEAGCCAGCTRSRNRTRESSQKVSILTKTDNPLHFAYHRRNRRRGRMAGQLRIRVRYQKYATPWFDYLVVSRKEMGTLLRGTGWAVERFLPGAPTYIAVIGKIC